MTKRAGWVVAAVVLTAGMTGMGVSAGAEVINVPITTAQSSLSVTLTIQGQSSTDSSPVAGYFKGELFCVNSAQGMSLTDF
ncbi:MAG TPA: hypothetical protein VG797_05545, partial [Phycisphaerales bacterium]|nr:hypothetical protein [Phycisphaerales bacterium]